MSQMLRDSVSSAVAITSIPSGEIATRLPWVIPTVARDNSPPHLSSTSQTLTGEPPLTSLDESGLHARSPKPPGLVERRAPVAASHKSTALALTVAMRRPSGLHATADTL